MSKKKHASAARRLPASADPAGGFVRAMISAGQGTLWACLIGVVLLFAAAALAGAQEDPQRLVRPLGYAVSGVVAMLAGGIAVRRNGRAALLCGVLTSACVLLLFFILSLIPAPAGSESLPVWLSLLLHSAVPPLSVCGAFLGRKRGKHKPR